MFWRNRQHAGLELAQALSHYRGAKDALVLGLPRGGVVVAHEVAKSLGLPLDVVVTRKIGAPGNPELALGAIDEKGKGVFNVILIQYSGVAVDYLDEQIETQKKEVARRLSSYRARRPPLNLRNKTAILVDDGVATGATMMAAIRSCESKGAKRIVVAAPVAAPDTLIQLHNVADEIVFLDAPPEFGAVGQFYEEFEQVEDEEVIRLLGH